MLGIQLSPPWPTTIRWPWSPASSVAFAHQIRSTMASTWRSRPLPQAGPIPPWTNTRRVSARRKAYVSPNRDRNDASACRSVETGATDGKARLSEDHRFRAKTNQRLQL